ncbi:MAG: response regulator transcription factor [Flavobacteriales bacterium]|nr:response regulator transcription factor [Flavobacteriales bacterium]
MGAPIRTAIVEDDAEIRDLLRATLGRTGQVKVVGAFADSSGFLASLRTLDVDVVLMDINMPGMNGIDCIREAKPLAPKVQFLVLTVFENPAYIFQALCAGATGYLVKNSDPEEIIEAVQEIHVGGSPMSPAIARLVVGSFQHDAQQRINDHALTDREKHVLDQLSQGLLYKEIAANAGISIETVRKHARHIYEKLQVSTRVEAIRKVYPGR